MERGGDMCLRWFCQKGGGGRLCTAWALPIETMTSQEHEEGAPEHRLMVVVIFSGGSPICSYPMILVSTQSRGRLERGSRYFR